MSIIVPDHEPEFFQMKLQKTTRSSPQRFRPKQSFEPEPIDQDTTAVVTTPVKMDSAPKPESLLF